MYDWSNSIYAGFEDFLKNIYSISVNYYLRKKENDSTDIVNFKLRKIREFVNNIEYYFYELIKLGYVKKSNVYFVIRQLISIELINFVKKNEMNFSGYTIGKRIFINPYIKDNKKMNAKQRTLLYSSHEYGHIINQKWKLDVIKQSKKIWENAKVQREAKRFGFDSNEYFVMGFEMLDETIVQDTAENVCYGLMKQERSPKIFKVKKEVFGDRPFLTNFDYYGEFQEVAVNFCKTLGIMHTQEKDSYEDVLKRLSMMAMKEDFSQILFEEFAGDITKLRDYFILFSIMGTIKDASYSVLDLNEGQDVTNKVLKYYGIFNNLCDYYKK